MTTEQPTSKRGPLWIVKTRAPFFTASIVPVLLGTAIAWARTGTFELWVFLLTLVGAVCLQAGTNMTNDYFDHTWGSDEINTEFVSPFSGGSRLIQMGIVEPKTYLRQGVGFFAAGGLIGLALLLTRGPWVLWLGIAGALSGFFYTAPPLRLAGSGLGEGLIGLNFGPLVVLGSTYTQTRTIFWESIVASLPVAILITLVVWINQFQDAKADAAVGKRHWVVRLGRRRATTVYGILLAATYLSLVIGVLWGPLPPFTLVALLTAPLAARAYGVARVHYAHPRQLVPANATTIRVHLLTGLLMSLGYVAQGVVR